MNKTVLRAGSLAFAVLVTGFLVARAAGCTSPNRAEIAPPVSPPPALPVAAVVDAGAATDAGPAAELAGALDPSSPAFLPATKAAMPILRPQPQAPNPPTPTQAPNNAP